MSDSANEERERRLLEWCKQKTGKYNVSVNDFDESWKDGLAFLAILYTYYPNHFQLTSFDKVKQNTKEQNAELILKISTDEGMPTSLEVSDFSNEENIQKVNGAKKKTSPELFRNKVVSTLLNWYSYLIKHHPRKSIRVDILSTNSSPILPSSSYTSKPKTNQANSTENGLDPEWMEKVKKMQERRLKMKEEYENKVKSSQEKPANVMTVVTKAPTKTSTLPPNSTRNTPSKISSSQSFITPSKTSTSSTLKPSKSQFIPFNPAVSPKQSMSPSVPLANSLRSQASTPAPKAPSTSPSSPLNTSTRPVATSRIVKSEPTDPNVGIVCGRCGKVSKAQFCEYCGTRREFLQERRKRDQGVSEIRESPNTSSSSAPKETTSNSLITPTSPPTKRAVLPKNTSEISEVERKQKEEEYLKEMEEKKAKEEKKAMEEKKAQEEKKAMEEKKAAEEKRAAERKAMEEKKAMEKKIAEEKAQREKEQEQKRKEQEEKAKKIQPVKPPVKTTVFANATLNDQEELDSLLDELSKNPENSPTIELSPTATSGKYEVSVGNSELQELNEATSQLEAILTTVENGKDEEISNPEDPKDEEQERPASISDIKKLQSLNRSESVARNSPNQNVLSMEEAHPNYLYYLARAVTDFVGQETGELSFKKNDILEIYDKDDSGWWKAGHAGKLGWVPSEYIVLLEEEFFDEPPPSQPNIINNNINAITNGMQTMRGSADSVVARGSVDTSVPSRISRSLSDEIIPTSQRRSAEASIPSTESEFTNQNETLRSKVSKKELSNLFEKIDQEELAPASMQGFLLKQDTTGVVKQWRRRFFSLRGSRLLYYKNRPGKETPPLGMIPIIFATRIEPILTDKQKKRCIFEIQLPEKSYYLEAETTNVMVDWIVALKDARSQYGSKTTTLKREDGIQRSTSSTTISMENSKGNSNSVSTQRTPSAISATRGSIDSPLVSQVKQGHLELFGNGKWKKRWYKVQGGILTEYKNQNASPVSNVPLYGCSFEKCSRPEFKKYPNCIEVGTNFRSHIILKAENEQEMQDWISILLLQKRLIEQTMDTIQIDNAMSDQEED